MVSIVDEMRDLVPPGAQHSGTGWYNFNCPSCGDKRKRGGLLFTDEGGFKYYCFNGGCEFNIKPTGWSPEMDGFGGRPRRLFEDLGGDIRRIPVRQLMRRGGYTFDQKGNIKEDKPLEVSWRFPEGSLPEGSMMLLEAAREHTEALDVLAYLKQRKVPPNKIRGFDFVWTPKHPYHLIIPYIHHDTIVGYVGRSIRKSGSGSDRFIQNSPSDYIFNQHLLRTYTSKYLFVVEAPLDAISLECLAIRNDRLTKKQANLLQVSGKDVVLIPDLKEGEWKGFFEEAKDHNWYLSIPDWGEGIGDVQESITKSGLLYTITCVMRGTTRNYTRAEVLLKTRAS